MVNALAMTNNIGFIHKLLNELHENKIDIRIVGVVTQQSQSLLALKTLNFSIIFLDESQTSEYDDDFLNTYKDIIVTLSYNRNTPLIDMNALKIIKDLVETNDFDKRRAKIIQELEYIGYNFKYKGTHYLIDTILQMYTQQHTMVDNLQTAIYPIISKKYNKSVYNIKSSINKATESMYYECDSSKLSSYFKFISDSKPTVKQVIFAIINKI